MLTGVSALVVKANPLLDDGIVTTPSALRRHPNEVTLTAKYHRAQMVPNRGGNHPAQVALQLAAHHTHRQRCASWVLKLGQIRWCCGGPAGRSPPEGPLDCGIRDSNDSEDRDVEQELEGGAPGLAPGAECQ